jgi:uncharacterized phage protein (TIGR02216 family)
VNENSFQWGKLMRAGIRGLGLCPAEFWALTPAELMLMLGQSGADAPLLSDGLAALMAAYPDAEKGVGDVGI